MNKQENSNISEQMVIRVMNLVESLPNDYLTEIMGKQLLRSAISFDANYRDACHGNSQAELISKLKIVEKEADESFYWLESIMASESISKSEFSAVEKDIDQIIEMAVLSVKRLRSKIPTPQS